MLNGANLKVAVSVYINLIMFKVNFKAKNLEQHTSKKCFQLRLETYAYNFFSKA